MQAALLHARLKIHTLSACKQTLKQASSNSGGKFGLHEETDIHNLPAQFIANILLKHILEIPVASPVTHNSTHIFLGTFIFNITKHIQKKLSFFASKHISIWMF
jgi:hypothetical protein